MKLTMISIFACVFIVASGFQVIGEELTTEQKEVWSAVEQYWSGINNGDVASTMVLIHNNSYELFSSNSIPLKKDLIKTE